MLHGRYIFNGNNNIFSKSVKFHINTLELELINDIAKSIRECSNVEFGYIIEDGK